MAEFPPGELTGARQCRAGVGAWGFPRVATPPPHNQNTFGPTEGPNEQWREANRRRQRQTIGYRGLVPTPRPPTFSQLPYKIAPPPLCFFFFNEKVVDEPANVCCAFRWHWMPPPCAPTTTTSRAVTARRTPLHHRIARRSRFGACPAAPPRRHVTSCARLWAGWAGEFEGGGGGRGGFEVAQRACT